MSTEFYRLREPFETVEVSHRSSIYRYVKARGPWAVLTLETHRDRIPRLLLQTLFREEDPPPVVRVGVGDGRVALAILPEFAEADDDTVLCSAYGELTTLGALRAEAEREVLNQ